MKRVLAALLLLDLGCVEQGRDDGGRADSNRNAGPHQLGPALLVSRVGIVVRVAHPALSMAFVAQ